MEPFYRAKLTLERVEPFTDKYDNLSERRTEIATVSVTGDTPGDAMTQIHDHAGTLYEWHDQPAPAVDEAFPALVLGDLPARIRSAFEGVRAEFSPGVRAAEANQDSDGEHADDPALRDTEADRDAEMKAALAETPEHTEAVYDDGAAKLRKARADMSGPVTGDPIVIISPPGPDPGFLEAVREDIAAEHRRRRGTAYGAA